jgi:hypothetical protein
VVKYLSGLNRYDCRPPFGDMADGQTDETNFESVMWPRAAALAEVFWTGAGDGEYPRSKLNW